ncbi:MAG TPA: DUF2336 domain-containing protein [Devosiaceae bacterium]
MVAYPEFVELSQSCDSDARGQAARMAAMAYLAHHGPADEHAALYAALVTFLDDPSVKVRAALAYGLLHGKDAPRTLMLALANDAPIIQRAVAQYSPVLLDADLIGLMADADEELLLAIAARRAIGPCIAAELVERGGRPVVLRLAQRCELALGGDLIARIAEQWAGDAEFRGTLLGRGDLPAMARVRLVREAVDALRTTRIVAGAIAAPRLQRLLLDATDKAVSDIGERDAASGKGELAENLAERSGVTPRLLLHALVHGQTLFFAECLSALSKVPRRKVWALLEKGSRASLNALLARAGLGDAFRNLLARLIFHARSADLADDLAARHFVVTVLIEDLVDEHEGQIPPELGDAFRYLNAQNAVLARQAARGVMPAFAQEAGDSAVPELPDDREVRLALPAA